MITNVAVDCVEVEYNIPPIPEMRALDDERGSFHIWARRSDVNDAKKAESRIPRTSTDMPSGDSTEVMRSHFLSNPNTA